MASKRPPPQTSCRVDECFFDGEAFLVEARVIIAQSRRNRAELTTLVERAQTNANAHSESQAVDSFLGSCRSFGTGLGWRRSIRKLDRIETTGHRLLLGINVRPNVRRLFPAMQRQFTSGAGTRASTKSGGASHH